MYIVTTAWKLKLQFRNRLVHFTTTSWYGLSITEAGLDCVVHLNKAVMEDSTASSL